MMIDLVGQATTDRGTGGGAWHSRLARPPPSGSPARVYLKWGQVVQSLQRRLQRRPACRLKALLHGAQRHNQQPATKQDHQHICA